MKTLRKSTPPSEEDFSRFANHLDLECNSFQTVAETTERIRKLLSIGVHSNIEKIIRSGAVPFLMQLLDTKEIEKHYVIHGQIECVHRRPKTSISKYQLFQLQLDACWAITNIVSGTSENTRYIVELGCVPLLIQLLSSEDDELNEQAVWAIRNIAGDSIVFRDYVLELGVMDRIVELMKDKRYKLSFQRNGKLLC